jgi:hypothetical protein
LNATEEAASGQSVDAISINDFLMIAEGAFFSFASGEGLAGGLSGGEEGEAINGFGGGRIRPNGDIGYVSGFRTIRAKLSSGDPGLLAEIRAAKALRSRGYNVHFVPESTVRTPDLLVGGERVHRQRHKMKRRRRTQLGYTGPAILLAQLPREYWDTIDRSAKRLIFNLSLPAWFRAISLGPMAPRQIAIPNCCPQATCGGYRRALYTRNRAWM